MIYYLILHLNIKHTFDFDIMRKEDKVHKSIIYTIFMVYGAIFDVDMKVQ